MRMTKMVSRKSRVAGSRVRKASIMGAAATALMAAAPSFSADASATRATGLQAAIRDILRMPVKEMSWRTKIPALPGTGARFNAISIGNGDDIIVGPGETALSHVDSVEDIALVNSGNLT